MLAIAFIATSCDFSYALAPESRLAQKDGRFKEMAGELSLRKLALSTIGYSLYLNLTEDSFREILRRRISKKDPNAASRFIITRKDQDGVYFTESGKSYRAFLMPKDSMPPKGAEPISLKDGRIFWLEKTPLVSAMLDNSTLFIYHPYYKGEAVGEEVSLDPILKHLFEKHKGLTVVLLRRHKDPDEESVKRESLQLKDGNMLITITAQGDRRQFKDAGFVRREIEDCFNRSGASPMRVWLNSWRDASGRAAVEACNELSKKTGKSVPALIWPRSDDLGNPEEAKDNENVKTLKMATNVAALSDYMRGRLTEVGVANVYPETVYSIADVVEKRLNTDYDARITAEGAALAKTWEAHGVKRAVFIPGSPAREKKNVYQALQWIEEMDKKLNKDRTTIFIATPDLDDVGERMLKEYALGRGLDVRLCGQLSQDDVAVYAAAAGKTGCVLVPSKDEPLGRVPAEVAGLAPVMVSDAGGLRETVGIPASILPLDDDAKAVEKLMKLFTDSDWRETIKAAQGELFFAKFGNFTWEVLERFLTSQPSLAPPKDMTKAAADNNGNIQSASDINVSNVYKRLHELEPSAWYSRTAVMDIGNGRVLAAKFLKDKEDIKELEHEAAILKELRDNGLDMPIPVVNKKGGAYVFTYNGALLHAPPETDPSLKFILYIAKKGHFTYPEDVKDTASMSTLAVNNAKQLAQLLKKGYIHTSLSTLTHEIRSGMPWYWTYKPIGGIENLDRKLLHSNMRLTGLADFAHVRKIEPTDHLYYLTGQALAELLITITYYSLKNGIAKSDITGILTDCVSAFMKEFDISAKKDGLRENAGRYIGCFNDEFTTGSISSKSDGGVSTVNHLVGLITGIISRIGESSIYRHIESATLIIRNMGEEGSIPDPRAMAIKGNKIYVADYGLVEFDIEKGTFKDIGERGSIPNAVAMAIKDNKIYVADYGKKCLVEFDIEKGTSRDIGERGSIPNVVVMAIKDNKIYVADYGKKCLVEFDIEKGTFKDIGERGSIPDAVAMTINGGKIYVADCSKKCLVEFDIEKGTSKDIGERGSINASAMAIKDNKIYVADYGKKCLVEFDIEKGTSKDIGERGSMPDAVAMAIKDNKIYVADRSKKCLVEFNIPEPAGVNTRPTDPVGSTTSANPPKDMTKPAAETDTVELKGTVISAGSATGNARKAKADTFESLKERAGKTPRDLTIDDVNKAIRDVIADLNGIISRSGRGSRAAQIIEPFRSLCDDSAFIEKIDGYIKGGMNAAEAVIKAGKEEAGKLRALKDAYLQQRALSFTDAYLRIVRKLLNEDRQEAIHGPDIVVTNVLYPTDIVDRYTGAKAIIVTDSDVGDRSDAALIAKSLNIPVIVVNDDRMRSIPNGTEITVDADNGTVSFEGATQPTRLTDPVGLIVPTAAVGTVLTREVTWAEKLANTIKISAAEADTENHRIIIGLQTDEWVPGEQASDIQALERAVKRFADTLKRRGVMQNVSIVLGSSKNLAANIASEKPASGDKVVILGSEKTLAQDEFKSFKDAYFAYVDLSKLKSLDYISLIEMIDMAVHFAVDNAAASNSGIQVETLGERIVRFTPSRRLDVEEPSKVYKLQIRELAKQA